MRLIRNVFKGVALSCAIAPGLVQAATYNWPIASSVDVVLTGPTNATYTVHMDKIIVNDPTITDSTLMSDIYATHMPYYRTSWWSWGSYHRHNAEDGGPATTASMNRLSGGGMTDRFLDVAKSLSELYGHGTISVLHQWSPNGGECVGTSLMALPTQGFVPWIQFPLYSWNGGAGTVVGTCLGTPPANQWCALTEPAITLDFGSQVLANAPSARASATTRVECTTGMKYTLRLRGQDAILLANGMIASLTVNNQALGSTLNGESGLNTVTIGASLLGTPESGSLNGNGVLFVSYP